MSLEITKRITSKDLVIEAVPNGVVQTHIYRLFFETGVTGGTFKLRVNGKETANITFSSTIATLLTNINTALDAVTPSAGMLVATGTSPSEITITSAAAGNFRIEIAEQALTGSSLSSTPLTDYVVQRGGAVVRISTDVSSFDYDATSESIDVTAISEEAAKMIPVKRMMSFTINIFDAQQDWLVFFREGDFVRFNVYPTGKVAGQRWFSFIGLLNSFSKSYPDHEKVEIEMSGDRVGEMLVPFETVYNG